jgi:formylglycine-generating enzyme required for sulfatase activity
MLDRYAWYEANSANHTWPVGMLKPNDFGLFDVHGNALEWCHSWYFDEYPRESKLGFVPDTVDVRKGIYREMRGGTALRSPAVVRSADRDYDVPAIRSYEIGFRIARTLTMKQPP